MRINTLMFFFFFSSLPHPSPSSSNLSKLLTSALDFNFKNSWNHLYIRHLWWNYFWNKRWHSFSNSFPVNSDKERMNLNFHHSIYTESFTRICYQFSNEICCSRRQIGILWNRKCFFPLNNFLASYRRFIAVERRVSNKHFKQDHSYTPPIYCFCVSIMSKHFWSDVIWCPHSRESELFLE